MDLPPLHNLTIFLHWKEPRTNSLKQLPFISLLSSYYRIWFLSNNTSFSRITSHFHLQTQGICFHSILHGNCSDYKDHQSLPLFDLSKHFDVFLKLLKYLRFSSIQFQSPLMAPQFPSTYLPLLKICPWYSCPLFLFPGWSHSHPKLLL